MEYTKIANENDFVLRFNYLQDFFNIKRKKERINKVALILF